MGKRKKLTEKSNAEGVDSADNSKLVGGRPRDFDQVKKNRSLSVTDDHWELFGKAAYPESRSQWLAEHLDENAEKINQSYKEKKEGDQI